MINEIVYRDTPPYREEFSILKKPDQLNLVKIEDRPAAGGRIRLQAWRQDSAQELSTLGVVTPYVSFLRSSALCRGQHSR